jgi:amino acid transporter
METQCPDCEKSFDVPDEFDGQPGKCSNCGSNFTMSSSVMITAGGLSDFMPELPPLNEPDPVYHSDTSAAVLEQDSFDAPAIPPGCVTNDNGPRPSAPARKYDDVEDTTQADDHAYFDDLEKKEKKKKKKRKSFSLSYSSDTLPGDGFATFMFTFGVIGVIASYTLFVVGLSKNLMPVLQGTPHAFKRLMLWLAAAAAILFISVLKLSFANIIKAINANTRLR